MSNQRNIPKPTVGVDKFGIAVLTKDAENEPLEYGEVMMLPGLVKVGWNPDVQTASFAADNGIYAQDAQMGAPVATVEVAELPPEIDAVLLGNKYDGGVVTEGEINPPYVALLYRVKLTEDTYGYRVIYKAKAAPPNEEANTQGTSISYQHSTIVFNCAKTVSTGEIRKKLRDDDVNLPAGITKAAIEQGWYSSPLWQPNGNTGGQGSQPSGTGDPDPGIPEG